ncbi:TetR/AcrR family transcriptional regulator [Corynebacterium hansenii]|uniref:TetR/AcrR family transcriptional regulator n=1 Tax=Corynebacterium hansenii TaxID=394964 RepID=A0ABV7ZPT4_9CORY|nr:TetR/AcrR family transcriptional regulator [Corynebacterium hansenii]WJZ00768.1 Fatty acid metabolism regulator protein [Corynebacterium hansenii]
MPKITGPTVVEHRAAQHRALLDAAERLIGESGGDVPTLTEVAEAMGLARSSVYLYVKSRKDLVVQLLLDIIPNWTGGIADAMDAAGDDPLARLEVYVDETFRLFAKGDHGQLMVAAKQVPEAFMDPRVQEAHNALVPTLHGLLRETGGPVAVAALPILDVAAQRGAELVASGRADEGEIREGLRRMLRGVVSDGS